MSINNDNKNTGAATGKAAQDKNAQEHSRNSFPALSDGKGMTSPPAQRDRKRQSSLLTKSIPSQQVIRNSVTTVALNNHATNYIPLPQRKNNLLTFKLQ